jgi:3-methyladenine DNA glycosylase/8-oxoguanine DNA glycosylase
MKGIAMNNMQNSINLLTSIRGVGKWKSECILAYCGSIQEALKANSLLIRGKIPGIEKQSEFIYNELKKLQNEKISNQH